MKQVLLTVGRARADYAARGLEDYARRLRPWGGLELAWVKAERAGGGRPPREILEAEAGRILQKLKDRDLVWALDRRGRAWSSRDWAARLDQARLTAPPRLVLVVGGPLGLGRPVLERAQERVSLGPATFAHELAALVVAEQLYRAHTILAGTPYHR